MKDAVTIFAASASGFDKRKNAIVRDTWPEEKSQIMAEVAEWYKGNHSRADEEEVADVTDVASVVLDELFVEHTTRRRRG